MSNVMFLLHYIIFTPFIKIRLYNTVPSKGQRSQLLISENIKRSLYHSLNIISNLSDEVADKLTSLGPNSKFLFNVDNIVESDESSKYCSVIENLKIDILKFKFKRINMLGSFLWSEQLLSLAVNNTSCKTIFSWNLDIYNYYFIYKNILCLQNCNVMVLSEINYTLTKSFHDFEWDNHISDLLSNNTAASKLQLLKGISNFNSELSCAKVKLSIIFNIIQGIDLNI